MGGAVSYRIVGEECDRPNCRRPVFLNGFCSPHWRLYSMFRFSAWLDSL